MLKSKQVVHIKRVKTDNALHLFTSRDRLEIRLPQQLTIKTTETTETTDNALHQFMQTFLA